MGNVYSLYNQAEETKSKEETGPSDLKLPVNQKANETEPVKKTGISDSKLDHEVEATACKEKSVTPVYKSVNNAVEQVKKGLHSVKVSRYDATELERKLEGELFDNWTESCEVMKAVKIPIEKLCSYLDHMQKAYEGIDDQTRQKMDGILFTDESWDYKLVEWKFSKGKNSGARYGMMAFGRSPDLKYVDSMYVLYKMDFKIAPKKIVTKKEHSWLFSLFSWTSSKTEMVEQSLGSKSIKNLQNFFRLKALEGFYKEGLIETINYVDSLDNIPDSIENSPQQ